MALLHEVYAEFNSRLAQFGQVIIAGGSVRDTLMGRSPKDFDVFVLHDQDSKFENMKGVISTEVEDLSAIPPIVEWHKSEPYLVASVEWQGREIQIMANPAKSPDDLLDTFDWSVCLYAFDGDHMIAREPVENIQPGKELWLQRITYPMSTLRRGFRFSERFKMKLKRKDVQTLCEHIVKGPKCLDEPDMEALEKNVNPN